MSDYKRIYLQPECCADPDVGRLWCQDDGPESCPDGEKWTPYVLASECDRLQSELEKAEARVAELHQAAYPLYSWCAEKLSYEQFKEAYEYGHRLGQVLEGSADTRSFLLRVQADAVEAAYKSSVLVTKSDLPNYETGFDHASEQYDEHMDRCTASLRQQAAELEKGETSNG